MNYIKSFKEELYNHVKDIFNNGYIEKNAIDSFIEEISEIYVYHIKPINENKERELYSAYISSIEDIPTKGGSKQDMADILCSTASRMRYEHYGADLFQKAYNMYKEQSNYHGIIFCGAYLADYKTRNAKSDAMCEEAVRFVKENLSYIEERDSRKARDSKNQRLT